MNQIQNNDEFLDLVDRNDNVIGKKKRSEVYAEHLSSLTNQLIKKPKMISKPKHEDYFKEAGKVARSSLCLRDKCGAVVILDGKIIGRGYNSPPGDDMGQRMCHTDYRVSSKPKSDRTCCMHAEWRAIIDAIRNKKDITGSSLYFTRIDADGNLLRSGDPYCTVCSRIALDVGIKYFGLWQKEGIKMFDTKRYNKLSYDFHLE